MSNTEKELKALPDRRIPPCKECGKLMAFAGRHSLGRKGGKADFFQCLNDDCSEGPQYQDTICWKMPHENWLRAMGLTLTRPASPLAEENKRLRDLVDKYGQHQATCPCWESARLGRNYCNCGYDEALDDTVAQADPIGEREDGCKACAQGVKGPYSQSTGAFHTCKPKGEREGE